MGRASIIRGNARSLPLANDSVDLVVTSPPYFALRSYQDAGVHYAGQIGDEPTPGEFVDALLEVTRECVRVLKPAGSLWVNLGDKYAAQPAGNRTPIGIQQLSSSMRDGALDAQILARTSRRNFGTTPQKSLLGVPWRYAIRCIDELGLILRAEVIWSKPNGLPESVTDRVRRSHETWFHFTRSPRYYSAVDEIREEQATVVTSSGAVRYRQPGENVTSHRQVMKDDKYLANGMRGGYDGAPANPLGKLPGSVWEIPTEPLKVPEALGVDHFAAFPTEWPRRIIQGWSPAGVCVECGEGRRPVTHKKPMEWRESPTIVGRQAPNSARKPMSGTMLSAAETTITGYSCACPEPIADTTPGVVLDPFGGTGTTALVAKALGRHGVSVDMSADYCRLATWRTTDEAQLAKALRVDKPRPQVDGQATLFEVQT